MATTIEQDAHAIRQALAGDNDRVVVTLSREAAEFVAGFLDARAQGRRVVITREGPEVSPNEAAALLGVSRPQVRRLMDSGQLEYRTVGKHHRITVTSVDEWRARERPRRRAALATLADLQNELGLNE